MSRTQQFSQDEYLRLGAIQNAFHKQFLGSLPADQRAGFRKFANRPNPRTDDALRKFEAEETKRYNLARQITANIIGQRWKGGGLEKAGISTATGFNFFDLRTPAFLMYPVNTPFRNQLAREGPVNAGVGTAAHWKGTTNVGTQPISIPEGFRAPVRTPNEVDFLATYKEFGVDSEMTFTAQWAGEGLTDNLADDHLRALQALWLGEEGTIINGNGGTGVANGFALGTPATPTLTQSQTATGTLASSNTVGVAVVMLTSMGYPSTNQYGYGATQTVTGGLIPSQTLNSAVGEAYKMPGGTSQISAISNTLTVSGLNNTVIATVANKPCVAAYAWYVSTNAAPSLATAYLYSITTTPSVTVLGAASATNQNGTAAGLNVDNSFNSLEFSGLLPMVANSHLSGTNGWTNGKQWTDLGGLSLTAGGHGKVLEVEAILENAFLNFQTGYTDIWGSPDAILALSSAVLASGIASTGFQIVLGDKNTGIGGNVVSGYISRYAVDSPTGANVIPLRMHPMIPPGTLYFHIGKNPYPQSRIGNVLAALIQRDYYSIEWPVTSRDWTFGTYVQYVLAHRLPQLPAILTGIGPYLGA